MAKTETPNPYDVKSIIAGIQNTKQDINATIQTTNEQFANIGNTIDQAATASANAIRDFQVQVTSALDAQVASPTPITLERSNVDINSVVAPMRQALDEQLTNMRNSYASQAQVQAKQLDAAVGAGAFGGNSFRAQQAYQSAMNSLFNQTSANMANTVLSAEQTILGATVELTGLQEQIDFQTISTEAQLNVEQDIRHRELQNNREVSLISLLGNAAEMTVEAGAVLTNNWINLFNVNNQAVGSLIRTVADLDIAEAGIRQTLARDVFQAEMQAINNNMQIQIAYRQAASAEYIAGLQYSASNRSNRASKYVAEVNAETALRIAQIESDTQLEISQFENQSAVDIVQSLGIGAQA